MLVAALAITTVVKAQNSSETDSNADRYNNHHYVNYNHGKRTESIQTNWHDKTYRMELVNKKMTELYVNDVKIPESKWGEYSKVIAEIKEQIRKDEVQAKIDQAQAMKDQAQARVDQVQARKDQAQATVDREQAVKEQQEAKNDLVQAQKDQEQAKLDQIQAKKDQEEAQRDQEEAQKDQQQAKLDQEQAKKDQEQALIDQKMAEEDQKLMKQMFADLVKDGIVASEKNINSITIDSSGMTVNGKKMTDEVYTRYKSKYSRFATGSFSYNDDNNGSHGIHMSRSDRKK